MQSSFVLHKFFFMFLLHFPWTRIAAEGPNITCSRKCGNLTVPYPFGVGINSSCSINPFFAINCDESSDPPKAFLSTYNFEVLNISDTEIRIKNRMAAWCYDDPYGKPIEIVPCLVADLLSSPFSLSTENKLTVVGCHDSAMLLTMSNGHEQLDPISACSALCSKPGELSDGFCSGIGCCQSSIPEGLQLAIISLSRDAHAKTHNFSSCSYSFLADKSSCNEINNSSEIICQQNSVCVDSGSILGGYRCSCYRGYEGNPYLSPGRISGQLKMRETLSHMFLTFLYLAWNFAEGANISKPGCLSKCGNLAVPYPFGIGIYSDCSIDPFFAINCNASFDPPKAFLSVDKVEVLGISDTKISVKTRLSKWCYDRDGNPMLDTPYSMDFSSTPFSFSNENKLTAVGCDDAAYLARDAGDFEHLPDLISSCVAICSKPGELRNGFFSGIGCCQSSIPEGLQSVYIFMSTVMEHKKVYNFSSCGYSFLAEHSSYNFNITDISDSSFVSRITETVPVAIDWAIGNKTCNEIKNRKDIICQANSVCGFWLDSWRVSLQLL